MAGVAPKFSPVDVVRALLSLSEKPLSRVELVEQLGLGEGSVRSVLNELKEKEWVISSRRGHTISLKGLKIRGEIQEKIHGPIKVDCTVFPQPCRAAIRIKKPAMTVDPVMLRDTALKWGADAALVLIMGKSSLHAPMARGCLNLDESVVKSELQPQEGDVVAVTFAGSRAAADTSALAVAIRADAWLRGLVWNTLAGKKRGLPLP